MNMPTNLISIILPVYNGENYLAASIESCLKQTHENFQLIIVNDCSTDRTLEIATAFQALDSRIEIITNQINSKLPASLNIGHHAAKGEFITWTSDDNLYEPDALEQLYKTMIEVNSDIVYSNYWIIDNVGQKCGETDFAPIENNLFGNLVGACFLYKKDVYVRNHGYDETLFLVEDYDFWLQAMVHSRFYHIKAKLYQYRRHEASLSNSIRSQQERNDLFRKNIHKMYAKFVYAVIGSECEIIIEFFTRYCFQETLEFKKIIKGNAQIKNFISRLKTTSFASSGKKIDAVFIDSYILFMIRDQKGQSHLRKSIFIIKAFKGQIHLNAFKTMIKYSFSLNTTHLL